MNLIFTTSLVRRAALLCLLSCLPLVHVASGATVAFENVSVTPETFLSNTTTSSAVTINWRYTSATQNRWAGFAFSAPAAASLTSVSFKLNAVQSGALGADMTISIVPLGSLTSAPATTTGEPSFGETVLYSETGKTPSAYNETSYITFTLGTPFLLEENKAYGIVLSFTSSEAGRQIDFSATTNSNANLGSSFYTNSGNSDGGAAFTTSNRTLNFVMNATPIPEPATTAALVAAGAAFCVIAARKRHRE